jgi:hypothetical protein
MVALHVLLHRHVHRRLEQRDARHLVVGDLHHVLDHRLVQRLALGEARVVDDLVELGFW